MSDDMDKRRSDKANEIITKMTLNNPSDGEAIAAQKKANKELLGHEGECDFDRKSYSGSPRHETRVNSGPNKAFNTGGQEHSGAALLPAG